MQTIAKNKLLNTDSIYSLYEISVSDSSKASLLVVLAADMETNNVDLFKNKSVDDYLQLANLLSSDSLLNYNLVFQINEIATSFRNNSNYLSALKFHNSAKQFSQAYNNFDQQSIIHNNIGVVYRRLDEYQTAIENHIQALTLAEQSGNLLSQAVAINSIGNIQMLIGNYNEALIYFKQSLLIEQKQNNVLGIAINFNNIGNVYMQKQDLNKALEYYNLSLDLNRELNSKKGIAICYNDIGNIYAKRGDYTKALKIYLEAFDINVTLNNKHGIAYSYLKVGEVYTDLQQYNDALEYLLPGLDIAIEIGVKSFIMKIYKSLYIINRANKNYEDAFNYLILSDKYSDSITNINVKKDIARLQIKFESERKENQIAFLEQNAIISAFDIKRQKFISWLTLGAFVIALGFIVSLLFYLTNRNKTNKLLVHQNNIISNAKTELDSYSKQLLAAKQEAEKNNKAKSEFLANMSHEIRTPLNAIIGFTELLSNSVVDAKNREHVKIIKSSSRTLLTIINDILDLSKIEAGKYTVDYENTNIELIVQEVVQMFSYRAHQKNIKIITNVKNELATTILFSPIKLRQILFNLVGNAIKFTKTGSITINAVVTVKNNVAELLFTVKDTGIGIKKSEFANVFDSFTQLNANNAYKGTGLGLAITKRIVDMMNGTINVESVFGEGTKFSMIFPNVKIVSQKKVIDAPHAKGVA